MIVPVMRVDRKKVHPCFIVMQFENKNDLKGKKRSFNYFDENVASMIKTCVCKVIQLIITK